MYIICLSFPKSIPQSDHICKLCFRKSMCHYRIIGLFLFLGWRVEHIIRLACTINML